MVLGGVALTLHSFFVLRTLFLCCSHALSWRTLESILCAASPGKHKLWDHAEMNTGTWTWASGLSGRHVALEHPWAPWDCFFLFISLSFTLSNELNLCTIFVIQKTFGVYSFTFYSLQVISTRSLLYILKTLSWIFSPFLSPSPCVIFVMLYFYVSYKTHNELFWSFLFEPQPVVLRAQLFLCAQGSFLAVGGWTCLLGTTQTS